MSLLILVTVPAALAGPAEDVRAATQAWVDGMNSHKAERVVALYDAEAVSWGTRSATLRDTPDWFSFVYRHRDGRWFIVDHHSSAVPPQ